MPQDPPRLKALDHLVLTVADIATTVEFCSAALGMTPSRFAASTGGDRWALHFGSSKINLHQAGSEFEPKAHRATPGSADLCFVTDTGLEDWIDHLKGQGIGIAEGPVRRSGATGALMSIYIRDPDLNLIEISVPA